jgi:hypothetical protein
MVASIALGCGGKECFAGHERERSRHRFVPVAAFLSSRRGQATDSGRHHVIARQAFPARERPPAVGLGAVGLGAAVPPECDRRPRQANAVLQTVPDKFGLPFGLLHYPFGLLRGTERSESWGALHNTLTTDCGGTAILRRSPPTERASRDTPTSAQSYRRFCFFRFGLSRSHSSPYRTIARLCGTRQFSVSGRIVCTRPARCHAGAPSSQVRCAPRHEIAGRKRGRCRVRYGDFAAGSGLLRLD